MRRVSGPFLAKCASALVFAAAVATGSSGASAGEFTLVNNSNDVVHVAVAHTTQGNRARDEGWYTIGPGQSQVVYRGDNDRIGIHMQTGPNRHEIRPHTFFGMINRYTSHQRFVREDTDTPGNIKFVYGPNLERVYFKDQNDQLPAGWFNTTYYLVNSNERFTVIP
jgi:uncharacterized membrane protein